MRARPSVTLPDRNPMRDTLRGGAARPRAPCTSGLVANRCPPKAVPLLFPTVDPQPFGLRATPITRRVPGRTPPRRLRMCSGGGASRHNVGEIGMGERVSRLSPHSL